MLNILLSIIAVINVVYIYYSTFNPFLFFVALIWNLTNLLWLFSLLVELNDQTKVILLKIFTTFVSVTTISLFYIILIENNINNLNFIIIWSILLLSFSIGYILFVTYLFINYFCSSQKNERYFTLSETLLAPSKNGFLETIEI